MSFTEDLFAAAVTPVAEREFGDIAALRRHRSKIEAEFGEGVPEEPSPALLAPLIERLLAGDVLTRNEIVTCCAGAAIPIRGARLLESEYAVQRLLDGASGSDSRDVTHRHYRRCFNALSRAYFAWAPEDRDDATTPWARVRTWLHDCAEYAPLPTSGRWDEIRGLSHVFTTAPLAPYPSIRIDSPEIKRIAELFGIPSDSWFYVELFRHRLRVVCALPDATFITELNALLIELEPFDAIKDWALAEALTRYSASTYAREEHAGLLSLAITLWGTPHEDANHPAWSRVKTDVREMVARWVVRTVIVEVLTAFDAAQKSSAGAARAAYWKTWADRIDDFYLFADSSTTALSAVKPLIGTSRWKQIEDGDVSGQNHAFLMRMGEYGFIEFSMHGNAMYPYEMRDLPIDLGHRRFRISQMKNKDRTLRVIGNNSDGAEIKAWTHQGNWQYNFTERLTNDLGLRR